MSRVNIDDLDDDDSLEYILGGELFTGEVVEKGGSGQLLSLITVVRGEPEGPTTVWYPDGTLKLREMVKNGRPVGAAQVWHANRQLAEEKTYDDQGVLIASAKWDAEGQQIGRWPDPERSSG